MKKSDLILHPVRLQILSTLSGMEFSTQEIAQRLYNIPISTLYRQMRILLDHEIIQVADTRIIKGTLEKIYTLRQVPHLDEHDFQNLSADQHSQYFLQYCLSIMDGFFRYLNHSGKIDFKADYTGFSEIAINASNQELDEFGETLQKAILKLSNNTSEEGRRTHKIAIITYPVIGSTE
jgi:DNA-binding transcriptional ArsR family regulator